MPMTRFDAGVDAGAIKVQHAEHDAVIGNAQRGHSQSLRAFDQGLDPALAIKQGELAMDMYDERNRLSWRRYQRVRAMGSKLEKDSRIISLDGRTCPQDIFAFGKVQAN